jgi:hypothetical protein
VLRTRAPLVIIVLLQHVTVQLACIKPAASVHPEPGSNSPLYNISSPRRAFSLFFVSVLSFAISLLKDLAGYLLLISIRSKNFFPRVGSLKNCLTLGTAKVQPFYLCLSFFLFFFNIFFKELISM